MIWFRFALLGLGTGALYAICALGLVLIYRASGVVNFAQTGFVLLGGYAYYELREVREYPAVVSVTGAVVIGALAGLAVHLLVMRPMRRSSPISRVVATLGVLVIIQSAAILRYKHDLKRVTSILPTRTVDIFGAHLGIDRMLIFGIGLVLTAVLWAFYRFTSFGRVTAAVAEGELAAASMGHSPDMTAGINWMVGAALGAFAGVLIGPITFLEPNQLVQLIVPVLAAALLGGFNSFPLVFAAAAAIGIIESEMTLLVTRNGWFAGWSQAVAFIVVIGVLVVRGKGIPLRSHILDRLPAVGSGRIRPVRVVVAFVLGCVVMALLSKEWAVALTVTVAFAMVCLSVVVVTGYAGQLSLAQFLIGTAGAFAAARLMAVNHVAVPPGMHRGRGRGDPVGARCRRSGTAHPRHQPGDRNARARRRPVRADPQQLRDHRRGQRSQGGAGAPPRLGHRPGQAPAAVRNRRPVPAAGDVPGRRQPAPWCGGSTSARSALRRASGGGAGRQRLFRQVVLVHARIWHRRSRRLHACVPQQQCCLLPIRHLHVDQRRDGDCRRWRRLHPRCSPRLVADRPEVSPPDTSTRSATSGCGSG